MSVCQQDVKPELFLRAVNCELAELVVHLLLVGTSCQMGLRPALPVLGSPHREKVGPSKPVNSSIPDRVILLRNVHSRFSSRKNASTSVSFLFFMALGIV